MSLWFSSCWIQHKRFELFLIMHALPAWKLIHWMFWALKGQHWMLQYYGSMCAFGRSLPSSMLLVFVSPSWFYFFYFYHFPHIYAGHKKIHAKKYFLLPCYRTLHVWLFTLLSGTAVVCSWMLSCSSLRAFPVHRELWRSIHGSGGAYLSKHSS